MQSNTTIAQHLESLKTKGDNKDNLKHAKEPVGAVADPSRLDLQDNPVNKVNLQSEQLKNKLDIQACIQKTEAMGDCAFHATFGQWDYKLEKIVCSDVLQKRHILANAIRTADENSPIFYLIVNAIEEMLNAGTTSFKALQEAYQKHVQDNVTSINIAWVKLEQALKTCLEINNFIITRAQANHQLKNYQQKFQHGLNQEAGTLYGLVMSVDSINQLFASYNAESKKGFDVSQRVLQDRNILKEYAAYVEKLGQWLLPYELNMIAHVFSVNIKFYSYNPHQDKYIQPENFNPSGKPSVSICFDGHGHFERVNEGVKVQLKKDVDLTETIQIGTKFFFKEELDLKYLRKKDAFIKLLADKVVPYLKAYLKEKNLQPVSCFISYPWAEENHNNSAKQKYHEHWVVQLAETLEKAGITVHLDIWEDRIGKRVNKFIKKLTDKSVPVLVVGTKLYLEKYKRESTDIDKTSHVVKFEAIMIENLISRNELQRERIFPILLEGTDTESFTPLIWATGLIPSIFVQQDYFKTLFKLIHDLYKVENRDHTWNGFWEEFEHTSKYFDQRITETEQVAYLQKKTNEILANQAKLNKENEAAMQISPKGTNYLRHLEHPSSSAGASLRDSIAITSTAQGTAVTTTQNLNFDLKHIDEPHKRNSKKEIVTVDTKTASEAAPVPTTLLSSTNSDTIINQILKLAEEFKKTKAYSDDKDKGKRTVLELYGFALGLSLHNIEHKKTIMQYVKTILKEYILEDNRQIMDVPLSNLDENLSKFNGKLKLTRLKFEKKGSSEERVKGLHQGMTELVVSLFDYIQDLLGKAPCRFTMLSLGSFASKMITPYSDVEYIILVDTTIDLFAKTQTYFRNFCDLFDFFMISFGESALYYASSMVEAYDKQAGFQKEHLLSPYLTSFKKGMRVDGHKKPQDLNRILGLINTPKGLLEDLPLKVIYEAGNHLTSALFSVDLLWGEASLEKQYKDLLMRYLLSNDYLDCIKKFFKEDMKLCQSLAESLEICDLGKGSDIKAAHELFDIKTLFAASANMVKSLSLFLISTGDKIELDNNVYIMLDRLAKGGYISAKEKEIWQQLIKTLFGLRLDLQHATQSAESKITFLNLEKQLLEHKLSIENIYNTLSAIYKITNSSLEKRKEYKSPKSLAELNPIPMIADGIVDQPNEQARQIKHKAAVLKREKEKHSTSIVTDQKSKYDYVLRPLSIAADSETELLFNEILKLAEPKNLDDRILQAKVQGLNQPFYISIKNARKILSYDERGTLQSHIDNVYYKQNPERFLTEQAVYQMSLLLGGGIIAPTRLLIIEIPNEEKITVQASLAIEGENLEYILRLQGGILGLKKRLGSERFSQEFPILLKELYLTNWLTRKGYDLNMAWKLQLKLLTDTLFGLSVAERPLDFQNPKLTRLNIEKKIFEARLGDANILGTLALMDRYPELVRETNLGDLLHMPDLFKLLKRLYPKDSVETILKELPELFHRFDSSNISKHFLLVLLIEPHDHQGNNFKVKIKRDMSGKLQNLEIIGIDNDMTGIDYELGMEGSIRARKPYGLQGDNTNELQYSINVKSFLYGVKEFLAMECNASVLQSLMFQPSHSTTIHWLGKMLQQVKAYLLLLTRGMQHAHRLDKQLLINFADRFAKKWTKIQVIMKENSHLTHKNLQLEMEPILGRYCEELSKDYLDPQSLVLALYNEKNISPLKKLLADRMNERLSDGKSLQEHLLQIIPLASKFCTYEESFRKFILQDELFLAVKHPQMQIEIISFILEFIGKKSLVEHDWSTCLALQDLHISFDVFSILYQKYSQSFIELLKSFSKILFAITDVSIRTNKSGTLKTFLISPSNPNILFYAIRSVCESAADNKAHVEILIKGLSTLGINISNSTSEKDTTLLHYAAEFCRNAIQPLIELGLDIYQKNSHEETALDRAIVTSNLLSVQALLACGAGRSLKLENALKFIQNYSGQSGLCQQLLSQNVELAWNLALKTASQEKETEEGVRLEGLHGRRYLSSELCKQIFKEGISAGFKKENLYGRHKVISTHINIANDITVGLHLKENPKLPGREMMVHFLAKHLFGFITPPVALWRFSRMEGFLWNKTSVPYPILASRSIEGNNLREVLNHHPHQLQDLDPESVSEAIVLALLTNPEDGHAGNYILQPMVVNNRIRYRIISIDNDHAFVRPLSLDKDGQEKEGSEGLQVKTMLYCLNEMKAPLHKRVLKDILSIDPYHVLDTWLQDLEVAQKQIDKLFDVNEKKHLKQLDIYLDIEFKPSIVVDIYEKLLRIKTLLAKHPESSGLTLLRHTIPNLSLRYINVFEQYPNEEPSSIDARFNILTKGCFDKQLVKVQFETHMYIWPRSRVSAATTPDIQGHAIIFIREEVNAFSSLQAYLIRNGQWVTLVSKGLVPAKTLAETTASSLTATSTILVAPSSTHVSVAKTLVMEPTLKSVAIDFQTLATMSVAQNGLVKINKQNQAEIERIIQQVMDKMKLKKEQEFSKTKSVNIIDMTKVALSKEMKIANEEAQTPLVVRKTLKEVHEQASKLKIIRDELQEGDARKFRALLSMDYKTRIVNGTGIEFPGINFAKMKLPNGSSDLKRQIAILEVFSEVEFLTLRIQGCKILTDKMLGNVLKNSKGLLALSLVDCPKLTDAAISILKRSCPNLEKLELSGLNLMLVQESFPSLRVLRIENCEKLSAWKAECLSLQKFDLVGCPLFLNKELYSSYPFLLPMSQYTIDGAITISVLMQKLLTERNVSLKLIPASIRQKILLTLSFYFHESLQIEKQLKDNGTIEALFSAIEDTDWRVRAAATETLGDLSARLPEPQLKVVVDALLGAIKDVDWRVRAAANIALGDLGARLLEPQLKVMVDALLDAIKDVDWHVRAAANIALGDLGARLLEPQLKVMVDALLGAIKDVDWRVIAAANKALGNLSARLPEPQLKVVVDALLGAIKDVDWRVRAAATETLGDLSARLPEPQLKVVVDALLGAIKEGDSDVRVVATKALGDLGARLPESQLKVVVDALLGAIKKGDSDVRVVATKALGDLGARLPESQLKVVVDALLGAIKDVDWRVRPAANKALGDLGARLLEPQLKVVVDALLGAIKDGDSDVRAAANKSLGDLVARLPEPQLKVMVDALLGAIKDRNSDVRAAADKALGDLGARLLEPQLKVVVDALLGAIKDVDWRVRAAANIALGDLGARLLEPQLKVMVDALLDAIKDVDWHVRAAANIALGDLGARLLEPQLKVMVDALLDAIKDVDWHVRAAANIALGDLGARLLEPQLKVMVDALLGAIKDVDWRVIAAANKALGNLSARLPEPQLKVVVDALLGAIKDVDWRVIAAANKALGDLGARLPEPQLKVVVDALLGAIKDGDSDVRAAANKALSDLVARLPEPQLKVVVDALLGSIKDRNSDVRAAANKALGDLGARLPEPQLKVVVDALLGSIKDRNSDVRAAANKALGDLGARLPEPQLKVVVDALLGAIKDRNSNVSFTANIALGDLVARLLEPQLKVVVDVLLGAIKDVDWRVRAAADKALGDLGARLLEPQLKVVVDALLGAIKDGVSDVRVVATKALGDLVARLLEPQLKVVVDALLGAIKNWSSDVRAAANKALGDLSTRLPESQLKVVVDALLGAIKDGVSDVRVAATEALGGLGARLLESQLKIVVAALLDTIKDENTDVRAVAVKTIKELSTKLPAEHKKFMNQQLLKALNQQLLKAIKDKSFASSTPVLISILAHFISPQYFNTNVANSIKQFLSALDILLPAPIASSTIHEPLSKTSIVKESSDILSSNNSGVHAVALGVCNIFLQQRDKIHSNISSQNNINQNSINKVLFDILNPILLRKTGLNLLNWLDKEKDNNQREGILAPILCELAVDYIESHYDYYREGYESSLLAAFEQYKLNQLDDTFSVHPYILKKFEEFKNLASRGDAKAVDVKGVKETQESQKLITWWNKGVGGAPSGLQEYLKNLKMQIPNERSHSSVAKSLAAGTNDRKCWGGDIEVSALAFRLGISIKSIQNISHGEYQEKLLGIGYGCLPSLTTQEIEQLISLKIGSRFHNGVRLEVSSLPELIRLLNLEIITESELKYLDENGMQTLLTVMNSDDIQHQPGLDHGIKELGEKLQRMEVLHRSKNGTLSFISGSALQQRLHPVSESLKKRVLAAHCQPLQFTIEKTGAHWSYIGQDPLNGTSNLHRSQASNSEDNIECQKLGNEILNYFMMFGGYKNKFGIHLCNLIAQYAYAAPYPAKTLQRSVDVAKENNQNSLLSKDDSKTAVVIFSANGLPMANNVVDMQMTAALSIATPTTAMVKSSIDSKSDQEWKITLFDAVKAGRVEEVIKLLEANNVSKNIVNPKQKEETLLSAATTIKDNGLRSKMMAVIKQRVGLKPSREH